MLSIAAHPVAARLFALSLTARLPLAMLSIALLVHARELTGSFAVAGVVTGAYAAALGIGGPVLGRIADRRGHTPVVLASALAAAALLAVSVRRLSPHGCWSRWRRRWASSRRPSGRACVRCCPR